MANHPESVDALQKAIKVVVEEEDATLRQVERDMDTEQHAYDVAQARHVELREQISSLFRERVKDLKAHFAALKSEQKDQFAQEVQLHWEEFVSKLEDRRARTVAELATNRASSTQIAQELERANQQDEADLQSLQLRLKVFQSVLLFFFFALSLLS